MEKNGSKILFKLNEAVSGTISGECLSAEDISVLIDGTLGKKQKEVFQNHISSCDGCYETYLAALEMTESSVERRFRIFSPMSVAASIFIVLVAFVIFYKVNVGFKDIEDGDSMFTKSPVLIRESPLEYKADRQKVSAPVKQKKNMKSGKKSVAKPPAPGKSIRVQKSEEVTREAEIPEVKDEPQSITLKRVSNTQGISQSGKGAVAEPASLSLGAVNDESAGSDQKEGRGPSLRKKAEKGLIEKLREDEEKSGDRLAELNCFSREGDKYKRRGDFVTKIPLSETPPGIEKMVQPEDFKVDGPVSEPVYIFLEIITDKTGDVVKVCLVSGNTGNIINIVNAVKKWKFKHPGDSPARFRLALGISGNRIIEIGDKK